MNARRSAHWILPAALAALISSAFAVDPHPSISATRQFFVYCDDVQARARVASFADETKAGVLAALGVPDRWKFPIVITIERAKTAAPQPGSQVRLFETDTGFKVNVNVVLGDDADGMHFQNDIVRSLLLELAYRQAPAIRSGRAYAEPPAWLVEAIVQAIRPREPGENADVFKTLVAGGRIPSLHDFFAENPADFDSTSRELYQAHALSLLQLLVELPHGRASLAACVRDIPRGDNGDPVANLIAHFPALAGSEQSLEKWWALSLARFAASDRFHGMTAEQTEKQLAALLALELAVKDEKKKFTIDQFREYLKIPASRELLKSRVFDLAALSSGAHALFRPIIVEYEQILAELARGKTKDVPKKLATAATYREMVLTRLGDINDYLNWMEATQMPSQSGAFSLAEKADPSQPKRSDGITKYLDAMEREFGD